MLKKKYLHRSYRKSSRDYRWNTQTYHRGKNINLLSDDLPKHEGIHKNRMSSPDFTPLVEFIKSKIGENWDDVYSEILTKIDSKFRYEIEKFIRYDRFRYYFGVIKPIYDDEFIPRDNYGRILANKIYIDLDNILCKKTKEEILIESKMYIRRQKLLKIMDNMENQDQEEQFS